MAIKYLDGGRITGLSIDEKPDRDRSSATAGGISGSTQSPPRIVEAGSEFIETDTGTRYIHNGLEWVQKTFDSISEALGKDKGVSMRTHFVDWFCGHSLNTNVWGKGGNGSEIIRMWQPMYTGGSVDTGTIGGGVLLQPANNDIYKPAYISTGFSGTRTSASANTIRQFSHFGSSIIWCERWISGGGSGGPRCNTWEGGFAEWSRGDSAGNNSCFWVGRTNWTNYKTRGIKGNGTQANTDSGVPETNDLKSFRLDIISNNDYSGLKGSINGVLRTTQSHASGDISAGKFAVNFGMQGTNASNYYPPNQRVISYVEAWNH